MICLKEEQNQCNPDNSPIDPAKEVTEFLLSLFHPIQKLDSAKETWRYHAPDLLSLHHPYSNGVVDLSTVTVAYPAIQVYGGDGTTGRWSFACTSPEVPMTARYALSRVRSHRLITGGSRDSLTGNLRSLHRSRFANRWQLRIDLCRLSFFC